jgi:hypothetical protein
MTQDEIIEMAQECGLIGMRPHLDGIYSESLVAFANLVAAKAIAESESQEPVAYINVEERKLEWAKPMSWNTPTTVKLDKISLYTHPSQRTEPICPECKAKVLYECVACSSNNYPPQRKENK